MKVTNAYDHQKQIFLNVGENLYCERHKFKNEEILSQEAIIVEYDSIEEAMEVINKAKTLKTIKQTQFGKHEDES
jgi:hypothetical protein